MTDLDKMNEFTAVIEATQLPDYLKDALLEAFNYTHHEFVIPRGVPLPEDIREEIERRLKILENHNRSLGVAFDEDRARAELEKQARKFPQRFQMNPEKLAAFARRDDFLDKTVGMNMRNSGISVPTPREARSNYYKAAVDVVARTYKAYGIPFDAQKNLDYIQMHDRDSDHHEFERASSRNLSFPTFDAANTNYILNMIKKENSALRSVLQNCYWFLDGLKKAQADGSENGYLVFQRSKYSGYKVPEAVAPESKLTEEDQAEFDRREEERIAMENAPKGYQPVASKVNCIADLRDHFRQLPYFKLYKRFEQSASPAKLEVTPKPYEKFFQFLWRVERGNTPLGTFVDRLGRDMRVAYPETDWERTLDYYMNSVKEFKSFAAVTKPEADDAVAKGLVSHENEPIYMMWITFQEIKRAKERLGR